MSQFLRGFRLGFFSGLTGMGYSSRMVNCTERNSVLIRTSKFARHELEPSAHRRFEAALAEIVRIEDGIQGEGDVTL